MIGAQFRIGVGGSSEGGESLLHGPISHDFSSRSVAELPKGQDMWNFSSAVDPLTATVLVRLEVVLPARSKDIPEMENETSSLDTSARIDVAPEASATPLTASAPDLLGSVASRPNSPAPAPSATAKGGDAGSHKGLRHRSQAGQQRQFERWQRRLSERRVELARKGLRGRRKGRRGAPARSDADHAEVCKPGENVARTRHRPGLPDEEEEQEQEEEEVEKEELSTEASGRGEIGDRADRRPEVNEDFDESKEAAPVSACGPLSRRHLGTGTNSGPGGEVASVGRKEAMAAIEPCFALAPMEDRRCRSLLGVEASTRKGGSIGRQEAAPVIEPAVAFAPAEDRLCRPPFSVAPSTRDGGAVVRFGSIEVETGFSHALTPGLESRPSSGPREREGWPTGRAVTPPPMPSVGTTAASQGRSITMSDATSYAAMARRAAPRPGHLAGMDGVRPPSRAGIMMEKIGLAESIRGAGCARR